jgi:FkbM family methyltransferase
MKKIDESLVEKTKNLLADQSSREILDALISFRSADDASKIVQSDFDIYSHPHIFMKKEDMTIVDGGAYDGDTASQFNLVTVNKCSILCFEPSIVNLDKIIFPNVIKFPYGLFNKKGRVGFVQDLGGDTSRIIELDSEQKYSQMEFINVVKLDDVRANLNKKIDLIKLDIEGSERFAIDGAANVIQFDQPDLMISAYHRYDDIFFLINQIHSLNNKYRFYLGHHSQYLFDTVIYATKN